MTTRGLLFGNVAEDYERYRPSYPAAVAEVILDYARPPVERALEVGAGTGKATRLFHAHPIRIIACEPDADMRMVLARTTAQLDVEPVAATFEQLPLTDTYDLLYAASAWHWTTPETRWERAAALTRPGGTVAFFGGRRDLVDHHLRDTIDRILREAAPDVDPAGPMSADQLEWPGNELSARPEFTDVEQHIVTEVTPIAADDFVGYLATISAYLLMPAEERARVLERSRGALPDQVDFDAGVVLHLARRVPTD